MIQCCATGVVYRNPEPHMRAIHTWHPSIARLDDGEFVAAFDLGQGAESLDYRTYIARSSDGGASWSDPVRLMTDPPGRPTTHTIRISRTADGALVGLGCLAYRDNPRLGLVNRENLGYTDMRLFVVTSGDAGRTWEEPRLIEPPLVGPAFEMCHWIVELSDGRWLAPTSTWRGWNGEAPNGMNAIALVSHDRGRTWPEAITVMDRWNEGIIHWEQSLVELSDGRLLAVAWAVDERSGKTLSTPYAVADDGRHFGSPRPTGLRSQTAKITVLRDGRIFCLYRRDDQPGLWANVSRLDGDQWVNLDEACIWQGAASGMRGEAATGEELSQLRFGFPSMTVLPDGEVMAVFWCMEDCIQNIRWFRLKA